MSKRLRRLAALAAAAIVAGVMVAPTTATAAPQTLNVQVGNPFQNGAPGEGQRFYAPELTVHKGDTLNFVIAGFHTATLIPANEDVDTWVNTNVLSPTGPFTTAVPDPDDTQTDPGASDTKPSLKFNNAVFFPSDLTGCGGATTPCDYDGSQVLNSGVAESFAAEINANPGDEFWLVCLIHPSMRLKVTVAPESTPATAQADIDSYLATQGSQDAVDALAKHNELKNMHVKEGGAWQAWAGYDGEGYSLIAMYPKKHTIKKGQKVEWHFDQLIHEIHTVTMPKSKAKQEFAQFGAPGCDADGDDGTNPDNPPDTNEPPFCSNPTQLELDLQARAVNQYGNGAFKGGDYETSGIRGPLLGNTDSYTVQFKKPSGKKPFKYMCLVHGGFQTGAVAVKKR